MTPVPITWVDAFTDTRFGGNPAAVCLLGEPVGEKQMQGLARELGISETAFVVPSGDEWSLRWFTPEVEVDLCGHATLAAAHVLLEHGLLADGATARFQTRSGLLGATVDGELVELDFPASPPEQTELPDALHSLGAEVVATWRGGGLVLELPNEDAVRRFVPDLEAFRQLPDRVVYVTAAGDDPGIDYVLRVFGPKVGIDEDPVTGSAQCTCGPLWAERLGSSTLEVAQVSPRGGRLTVTVDGDRVRIAGRSVTVLRGTVDLG
jgi:PhzF family phenazine biosynthesis protein